MFKNVICTSALCVLGMVAITASAQSPQRFPTSQAVNRALQGFGITVDQNQTWEVWISRDVDAMFKKRDDILTPLVTQVADLQKKADGMQQQMNGQSASVVKAINDAMQQGALTDEQIRVMEDRVSQDLASQYGDRLRQLEADNESLKMQVAELQKQLQKIVPQH